MKKAFVYTFGCKVNQYESQQLIEKLKEDGYSISEEIEGADLAVVNSCTVTSQADSQLRSLVRKLKRKNPKAKIVVTGCYVKRSKKELESFLPGVEIVNKDEIFKTGGEGRPITDFYNHSRAFVKIQDGCDAFCSYCIVPYIRPKLYSKPIDEVVQEISDLASKGYPEIVLTGIHIGKYAFGLTELLRKLVDIKGDFRIRISSIEINEVDEVLLKTMTEFKDKICPHLHIPLQSASANILKKMNRHYSAQEFSKKLEMIYKFLPDAGVSTDVIVGFPGETEKDFNKTTDFLNNNSFSRLHIFRYSERPGTPAASFENKVLPSIIKERAEKLARLDKKFQEKFWRKFLNKARPCVFEEGSKTLLTDNYIRLSCKEKTCKELCNIENFLIYEDSGEPFGRRNPA